MKVLIVHYRFFITGGPERYLFNIKDILEKKGHEVIPFSISNDNNLKSDYSDYFVENIGNSNEVFVDKYKKNFKTYIDLIGREFYSFKVKKKLEKLIKDTKPDICYLLVYKRALSYSVIDACKKFNIPIVNRLSDYNGICGARSLYCNNAYCQDCIKKDSYCLKNNCIKGNKIYSLMRYLSIKFRKLGNFDKKINKYICTNQFMKDKMIEYGYSENKIEVIPTFFNSTININIRDNAISADNVVKFLFIGNIDETKGIYDLLNALVLLKQKTNNFHLDIVGGLHAMENQKVKDLIENNNLEQHISFYDFVKSGEIYNFYIKNNVTLLPTRWVENLPNTLVESLYCNRPVIVPNFGSFDYTTDDSISYKFDFQSVDSLYETLLYICNNPETIMQKSENCSQFFENNFNMENHYSNLIKIFEEAIN